jgi:hypothetical protein
VGESLVKDPRRQILGVVVVACPIVHIVIDLVNVLFVQETESFWTCFGLLYQGRFVYRLVHQDFLVGAVGLAQ